MNEVGVLTVFIGSPDVGQGSSTALAQIAADTVGIPFEWVRVVAVNSDITPPDKGSVGSRVTYVQGNAVRLAAEQMEEMLLSTARELLNTGNKDLHIREGKIGTSKDAEATLDVSVVARHAIGGSDGPLECRASFTLAGAPVDRNTGQGVLFPAFVYATQMRKWRLTRRPGKSPC